MMDKLLSMLVKESPPRRSLSHCNCVKHGITGFLHFTFFCPKPFTNCFTFLEVVMQGATAQQLGFNILLKDTSTCT